MTELINISFSWANIIPTVLLLLIVVYWITVILGALDMSAFDFDFDVDVDADADLDADLDGNPSADISWLNHILIFLGVAKVPLMIWLSFVAMPYWMASVTINHMLGNTALIGLAITIPLLLASMLLAKFLTMPFAALFSKLKSDTIEVSAVGKMCELTLPASNEKMGQAEVNHNGSYSSIYVHTRPGVELPKGATGLVIEYDKQRDSYLIEPYNSI